MKGVKSQDLIATIEKIPLEKRKQVKEITLDMASNMNLTAKICFPNADLFNSKIKLFRANQRGVRDIHFFLFRLDKLFT